MLREDTTRYPDKQIERVAPWATVYLQGIKIQNPHRRAGGLRPSYLCALPVTPRGARLRGHNDLSGQACLIWLAFHKGAVKSLNYMTFSVGQGG